MAMAAKASDEPVIARKSFREGIEESLEERAITLFRASLKRMTPEQLQRAVAAETAAGTVVEVLSASPDVGLQKETAMTRALARGAVAKQEMIVEAGGCLSSGEVSRMLGITASAVNIRRTRRTILTVPLSGGEWGFPARQFADGDVRGGVAEVVRAAGDMNPWVLLSILLDPLPGADGATLLDRLDDAEVRGDVLTRIGSYGEHAGS
jgi:hypothetical protein